ncbi:MAG TPA: EAL domain-containing protein [Acidimicrobiales bacterium]|nr:EAL domain-containing protein [Acidimicrobiales bacterium]
MVNAQLHGPLSAQVETLHERKLTCMDNLLSATDAVVYFKDERSRFLYVSAGWIANVAPGLTAEQVVGKTDFDFFRKEFAAATFEDEQRIMRSGEPVIAKLEQDDRTGEWYSSTKMPLRDGGGQVVGTFGIARNVTGLVEAEKALAYRALHDPVTGLANRTAFMDRLSQALLALERHPSGLAVLFVDLDHFKEINDSFGHDAGDQVLGEVGRRLLLLARSVDTVARLGGDEFVVLCTGLGDDDDVGLIADRIVRGLRIPYGDRGRDLVVTASVGVVVTDDPLAEPEKLVREADAAMYEAKKAGRDCYRADDSAPPNAPGTRNLRSELRAALAGSELFLVYQPLFALGQRSLLGVEALVRWNHPRRGVLLPNDFISFAEQHGSIADIGSFVLDEACRQLAAWRSRPSWPEAFTMAVNISARELSAPGLAERVAEVVRRHGINPARLCLEIPETALIVDVARVQQTLSALSNLGVRIALNDFGTGYSLVRLRRLNVDILKIDSSFVSQVNENPRDREIVAAVTAMSHALGITVVGGGIETTDQLDTLTALDCDSGQGFLFARPMSAEAVLALVGE